MSSEMSPFESMTNTTVEIPGMPICNVNVFECEINHIFYIY